MLHGKIPRTYSSPFKARRWLVLSLILVALASSPVWGQTTAARPLSAEQLRTLTGALASLELQIKTLPGRLNRDAVDAAVFAKGLSWALRYDHEFTLADVALMEKAVVRGNQRSAAIADGNVSWKTRKGKIALGYVSVVDESVQPYGLIVPKDYDQSKPIRLDVVLHGSTRPIGLSELRFIARFDEGDEEDATPPNQSFIELHPLGRVENCYRWAGETDVFEAIEDVCRRYNIDRDRIVLRGMSMGASGTWHLGLKHPDRFVALGPYCGYVDTHQFSETPLANFVKVGPLPEHQELGLHMLDSVDYAANAGVVPAIACMGEKDVFFGAHVIMGEAMRREGLTMVNLISPGTGHVIDPVTHAEQMRRIGEYSTRGHNHQPRELRFVTWTLKYSRCHWLQVLGLERHYVRGELAARLKEETVEVDEPKNITRFAILTSQLPTDLTTVQVGATRLALPMMVGKEASGVVVERREGQWSISGPLGKTVLSGKRPGIQGPIDDAFVTPFLCVRGTGKAWNPSVQSYCDHSLQRFADEWRRYFRGECPIKDDTAVTDEDIRTRNLILFGDPGSNSWIAKALPNLPVGWSKEVIRVAGTDYPAANHVAALIAPNPLSGATNRYIVINSGHTFREAELGKLNYLLFPRWGDWAVLEIDPRQSAPSPVTEKVLKAGYFNEQWQDPSGTSNLTD